MGSWSDLDANYPPGALTPATALVVALGHLVGARSAAKDGQRAFFLPRGLGYDPDLLSRVERYLSEVPFEQFLAEASGLLSARQKLVLALQLMDEQLAAGDPPERRPLLAQLISGIGVDTETLSAHRATLTLKNDLELFPQ